MAPYDPTSEMYATLRLSTGGGSAIDHSGLESCEMRLQLNAADEMTLKMPAQYLDGTWRPDMPIFMVGGLIKVEAGYNGALDHIQTFETVSTTVSYDDDGGEMMTVRGVSDLARAARTKEHKTFEGDDASVLTQLCAEYGWVNAVTAPLFGTTKRLKENGRSDLELLKRIAKEAIIGGPRVTREGVLIMPEPSVGELKYVRGYSDDSSARRLHSLQVNREAGAFNTQLVIIGWDPIAGAFIEKRYEADEFGGDPKIVYEGPLATKEVSGEVTTQGLVLAVVDHTGAGKKDRVDVLSSGRYMTETDADGLAARWFALREKLGRWADIKVDGHVDLQPYSSIEIDGNLAAVDKGVWLPTVVSHTIDASGWMASLRCVRVVSEAVIKPV